jgi:hypothetical protein
MTSAAIAIACLLTAMASPPSEARVTRFVVEKRQVFADGFKFGKTGAYERLDGTAYFEVSPTEPQNASIVNIANAPRNANGNVPFSTKFFIMKPVDMQRGNRKLFYGLNNRGNKLESGGRWNATTTTNDPVTIAHAGDGWMMDEGFTIIDAGWEGDLAPGNNRLLPDFPIAKQTDGKPIVKPVRVEYSDRTIPLTGAYSFNLEGNPNFVSYPASDTDTSKSTLTVRDTVNGTRTTIAADKWAFGKCPTGAASLTPSTTDICLFAGFVHNKLYELVYPAMDPKVTGLGYAVTRDIVSFLRYQARDDEGNANPLAMGKDNTGIRRAYGSGISSSGQYMRDWIYQGFNEDESHRKVFDAVQMTIAGAHRAFANVEFSNPNTYSRQDDRKDYLASAYPPFTYGIIADPVSGTTDGILKRPATDPLVMQVDSGNEFWNMRASLNVQDGEGKPVALPKKARMYFMSSYQHVGADPNGIIPTLPNQAAGDLQLHTCQNGTNPFFQGYLLRAAFRALDQWADKGIEPPASRYPSVLDGTLVSVEEYRKAFPDIPGVSKPLAANGLDLLDFGPEFNSIGGKITNQPPVVRGSYKILVPKPDKDGQDIAGIRPLEIRVPLGTSTGWNIRAEGFRSPDLCGLSGSFIPFAITKAQRIAKNDPRLSLEERYGTHNGYVAAVRKAAKDLVRERFLLLEDAERMVARAEASDVLRLIRKGTAK